jgi:hypothetical protein
MRKLVAALALATFATTPAFAQYGGRSPAYNYRAFAQQLPSYSSYGSYYGFGRIAADPYVVRDTRGRYIGSDPDPHVRSTLARDPANAD